MRRVARIVTPPDSMPVTVAEAGLHLGIFDTEPQEDLLAIYIASATALCEQVLQRKLITQTWKMWLDRWPVAIKTFFGDLQSVTHIKYTDSEGVQTTLPGTVYDVDTNSVPGMIRLKSGQSWPSVTLHAANPIEIQFVTGYGPTGASIPADIKGALLLTVAHFYENRENLMVSNGNISEAISIPWTASTLLNNHRAWDWIL